MNGWFYLKMNLLSINQLGIALIESIAPVKNRMDQ